MIAHTLPILVVAVALGVRAIPTPAPQGVTALITPGRALDSCIINYPGVYGISIRGVGSSAESSAATLRGAAAAGSGIARGAEGAASAASTALVGGGAEKLKRRQSVTRISDGQFHVVPALETRAPEIPAGEILTLEKATGLGIAVAGSAAACGSGATIAAGAVTGIADGQAQAPQKRSILRVRQNGDPLQVTLKGGVLTDILGRIGYIADNHQLQFDAPPQAGAIYTAGFSACPDGTLALGDSNVFYACGSSDFTNLYDILVYPDNCREVKLLLV